MAGRIIEAELRITGSDKSGAAFAGVIKHAKELEKTLGGFKNMKIADPNFAAANAGIREQTKLLQGERRAAQELQRSLALANGEMSRHASLFSRTKGLYNSAAGQLGMMATGAMAGHTIRSSAVDAADFAHQRALMTAGGMKGDEVKEAVAAAWKASRSVPTMTAAESLKTIAELRMVFGSTTHAIEHLQPVLKATAAIHAVNPNMDAESEAYNMARALEMKGVSNDPEHFTNLIGRMTQAVNASRGKVTGSDFFQFIKNAKAAAPGLSDEFFTTVAPTLMNELGGKSAGVALASMRQAIIGGKVKASAAEQFESLGLLDPKSIIRTKGGNVLGFRAGGMQGSGLFEHDPYQWMHQVLGPALAKHNVTDPDKINAIFAALFGNRNAEQFARILFNQMQRIEKDRKLISGAPNADSIDALRTTDPKTAYRDLSAAVTDFLTAAGSPLMPTAVHGMNILADAMRGMGQQAAKYGMRHPIKGAIAATGAGLGLGYLGVKGMQAMWGGFGLKGSAAALGTSATALDGAAAALTKAALANGGKDLLNGLPGEAKSLAKGAGAAWALRAALRWGMRGLGPLGWLIASTDPTAGRDKDEVRTLDNPLGRYWGPGSPKRTKSQWRNIGSNIDLDDARNHTINNPAEGGAFSGMNLGDAMGRRPVTAQIEGNANLKVDVQVQPAPDFWTRVKTMLSNEINAFSRSGVAPSGTSGSTGNSMPAAAPLP